MTPIISRNQGKLSKANSKMEKRLELINKKLALLPKPLASQLKDFASSILSHKIKIIHYEKRTHFNELTPAFFPSSTHFEFKLACKDEFKSNEEFLALKEKANKIVDKTKNSLRDTIISVQNIEEKGANIILQEEFIKGLLYIFELYSLYMQLSLK